MKKILSVMLVGLMLAPFCMAQNENDISLPEFRQCLIDMLGALNPRAQADYAKILPVMSDSQLAQIYKGVHDPKRFQEAARYIKTLSQTGGLRRRSPGAPSAPVMASRVQTKSPAFQIDAATPHLLPGIGDPPVPPIGMATPPYPNSGMPSWNALIGSIPPGNLTSAELSSAICTPDYLSAMTTAVSSFHSAKDAADAICEIVPDIFVEILGEGATVPAKEICYLVALIIGAFNSAFEGFLADCDVQGEFVAGAEGNAAYLNSVAIYNQKLRFLVEMNLQNLSAPLAMFELPASLGGYLESVRAIVKDSIVRMQPLVSPVIYPSALAALAQGDNYYNTGQYKLAYASYRRAFIVVAQ